MARQFDAVSLDVGGVLVVPDHGALAGVLADVGIAHDRARFGIGHYLAMAAMDRATSDAEDFTDYLWAFVAAGLRTVHMDPFDVCSATDHAHVRTLAGLLGLA